MLLIRVPNILCSIFITVVNIIIVAVSIWLFISCKSLADVFGGIAQLKCWVRFQFAFCICICELQWQLLIFVRLSLILSYLLCTDRLLPFMYFVCVCFACLEFSFVFCCHQCIFGLVAFQYSCKHLLSQCSCNHSMILHSINCFLEYGFHH